MSYWRSGSGNFLYVAFRELKRLELRILRKMARNFKSIEIEKLHSVIRCEQFYGIDINPFAVELAKITLSMGKKMAADEFNEFSNSTQQTLGLFESPLPFDDLARLS